MKIEQLSDVQLDLLKELTNIGGGNAATALSQLLNRKISMEVPVVEVLSYDEIFDNPEYIEKQVIAISLRILGDAPGNFLLILEESDAIHLLNMLMPDQSKEKIDDMAISALQEVTNILASSYVNALSRLLNICLISSVPAFAQDMYIAILTTAYIESGQIQDKILIIENHFIENNQRIKAQLLYIPSPGSINQFVSLMDIE